MRRSIERSADLPAVDHPRRGSRAPGTKPTQTESGRPLQLRGELLDKSAADNARSRIDRGPSEPAGAIEPAPLDPTDPRWVLAVRTAEQMEGAILPPEKRERLIRMGRMFGLTTFDANLVIAIMQDQARRGYEPTRCPTAGAAQLAMIPAPSAGRRAAGKLANHKFVPIIATVLFVIAIEVIVVAWLLS